MKVLLVGNPQSRFVIDYSINFQKYYDSEVSFHLYKTEHLPEELNLPSFEKVFTYPYSPLFSGNSKLKYLLRTFHLRRFLHEHGGDYDIIHFLYVIQDLGLMVKTLRDLHSKIILTIFGSDFMTLTDFRRKMLQPVFAEARKITFANMQTMKYFQDFYHFPDKHLSLCRFGLEPLEYLRKIMINSQVRSRRTLELPEGKIIVCVGYNSNSNQQHIGIIKSIVEQDLLLQRKNELFFIFPLTYGNESTYKERLLILLKDFPFENKVYETYLSEEFNAHLRNSTDIFIQLQKNDQFSGSMQEHLFARNVVITGNWLPYQTFMELGIYFCQVSKVDETGGKLLSVIDHLTEEKGKCMDNTEIIFQLSSWEKTIKSWIVLYQNYSNEEKPLVNN